MDPDKGLTKNEIIERLEKYGYNEVPESRKNPMRGFSSKFWGRSAWMLESIIILSAHGWANTKNSSLSAFC
jgi:magnesium-transporting ATPase (P-type)